MSRSVKYVGFIDRERRYLVDLENGIVERARMPGGPDAGWETVQRSSFGDGDELVFDEDGALVPREFPAE